MYIKLEKLLNKKTKKEIISKYGKEFYLYLNDATNLTHFNNLTDFLKIVTQNIEFHGHGLDFGCGYGLHTLLISPSCHNIVGVDINSGKISVLKQIAKFLKVKNVKALTVNKTKLPFPDKTFDFVYCHESLSHVQFLENSLKEIYRILKPKGRIIVIDTKRWSLYGIYMIYLKRNKEEKYFNIHVMKDLLQKVGFESISRAENILAPRNPLRKWSQQFWWLNKYLDPKYCLIGVKKNGLN